MRRTFLVTVSNPHILIKKWLLKHLSYMRHFLGEDSSLVGRNSLRENQEHVCGSSLPEVVSEGLDLQTNEVPD
jgi:hypothetical protein